MNSQRTTKNRQRKTDGRLPSMPFADERGVVVFAHRGERSRFPENTMLAFAKAMRHGVDALEIDIHMTADGVPVVIHDATLERTTNGRGLVKEMAWADLKKLDAGFHWSNDDGKTTPFRGQGIGVPSLAELFEAYPDLWINIDIKQHDSAIIAPFVKLIRDLGMTEQVAVGSFDAKTMRRFRAACPEVVTAVTYPDTRRLVILSKLGLGRFYRGEGELLQVPEVNGRFRVITPRFIADAHRLGLAVHVWTVNAEADMQRLIHMGVDGLITDFPARLAKL